MAEVSGKGVNFWTSEAFGGEGCFLEEMAPEFGVLGMGVFVALAVRLDMGAEAFLEVEIMVSELLV